MSAIFKKGDTENPGNYRHISLTSQVCKVFESMLRDSIVGHLKENKLIHDTQHGFMKNRSCLTNLLLFLETVTDYIDKGYPVDVIYLDFQKACTINQVFLVEPGETDRSNLLSPVSL